MKRTQFYVPFLIVSMLCIPTSGVNAVCGDAVVDEREDCDDGGFCVGGGNAGTACTAESECEGDGACFDGSDDLHGCRDDDDCREGRCNHCRPVGGDGCASNCRFESDLAGILLEAPEDPEFCVGPLTLCGFSGAVINGPFLDVPLRFTNGREVLTVGRRADGALPIAVKAQGFELDPIPVAEIACACVRPVVPMTCGGTRYHFFGSLSDNCTPGFDGAEPCPADLACAPLFGPGNIASGSIRCGGPQYDIDVIRDCGSMPGQPPRDPQERVSTGDDLLNATDGAAFLAQAWAIGTVVGRCTGTTPDYGPDGIFCTDDDPISSRGIPSVQALTTGFARGVLIDDTIETGSPAGFDRVPAPFAVGVPFVCAGDGLGPSSGTTLVNVSVLCDQPTVSDIVVTTQLVLETSGSSLCQGDCNGDRQATVDELMLIINVTLGNVSSSSCTAADIDADGDVTVDEVVQAVTAALNGCAD